MLESWGDNSTTAAAIAKECGILTSMSDMVIEGPVFRNMTPKEVDAILPHVKASGGAGGVLCVRANACQCCDVDCAIFC